MFLASNHAKELTNILLREERLPMNIVSQALPLLQRHTVANHPSDLIKYILPIFTMPVPDSC